jgi:hypothetical protein
MPGGKINNKARLVPDTPEQHQEVDFTHITSIKVLSRSLPRKSLFMSPTLLKSLSGDAEVAVSRLSVAGKLTLLGNTDKILN